MVVLVAPPDVVPVTVYVPGALAMNLFPLITAVVEFTL